MDKSAFQYLFDTHYTLLCNVSYKILNDLDHAEDIVQDVFVKLWSEDFLLDDDKNINSYLYTIVKNKSLEFVRRQQIKNKVINNIAYLSLDRTNDNIEEEELDNYTLLAQIYVSIRQLPAKCGEVFTLAKINGLSYTQIAERLQISPKTVENQMSKALKILRAKVFTKNKS